MNHNYKSGQRIFLQDTWQTEDRTLSTSHKWHNSYFFVFFFFPLNFHAPCNSSFQSLSCRPSNNKVEKYTDILCHVWKIYCLLHTNIHTQPDTHTHILWFVFSNLTSSITQAVGSVHYLTYHCQIQFTLFPQQLHKNVLNKNLCNIFYIWKIIFRGSV